MPWLEIFSGSLAISLCATLVVCRAAVAAKLLDQPVEARKIHVTPVPRLGGLGIVAGVYGSLLLGVALIPALREEVLRSGTKFLALAVGGIAIAGLGLYDDLRGANARTKFTVQCCVALLLYGAGFRILQVENPFGPDVPLGALSLPVTLLWIVGVTNAVNLIDGLDGLAGGLAVAAAAALAVTAARAGNAPAMLISVAVIGALVGFLVFNVNPAAIFMGDTGSLFLGAVLAALAILPLAGTESSPLLASAVVLGIPLADTLLAMARRLWRGASMFSADRGHLHHRLLDRGLSHRGAALWLWAAACLLAATGSYLAMRAPGGSLLLVIVTLGGGLALQRAGMFEFLAEQPRRAGLPRAAEAGATGNAIGALGVAGPAHILGYEVETRTTDECVQAVLQWMRDVGRCHCVECLNPHSYAMALHDDRFREALLGADTLLPDGSGIVLAARWLKQPVTGRVTGSDLFRGVMEALERRGGARVFFLGATEATLATIREKVRAEFPHVVLAGTYAPPFTPEFTAGETDAMVDAVNAAHADVLWVGMTAPKQEIWLHENHGRLNVKIAGAIGAVFDFYAGNVKRSPRVFQQLGLEWLHRLLQQPRRLWRRTFVSAPIFLWHTSRSAVAARLATPVKAPMSAARFAAAVPQDSGSSGLLPTPIRSGRPALRPSRMLEPRRDPAPAEGGANHRVHAAVVQQTARNPEPANLPL